MSAPAKDKTEAGATASTRGGVMRGRRVDAYFEFSAASFSSLSSLEVRVQMARRRRRHFKNNSGFEEAEVVRQCSGGDSPNDALWDLDAVHGDEFLQLVQTGHILYLAAELGAVMRGTMCTEDTHIKNRHK